MDEVTAQRKMLKKLNEHNCDERVCLKWPSGVNVGMPDLFVQVPPYTAFIEVKLLRPASWRFTMKVPLSSIQQSMLNRLQKSGGVSLVAAVICPRGTGYREWGIAWMMPPPPTSPHKELSLSHDGKYPPPAGADGAIVCPSGLYGDEADVRFSRWDGRGDILQHIEYFASYFYEKEIT